jgi:arginyl-tRNA synthetase
VAGAAGDAVAGSVAGAVGYAGEDPVRYALLRTRTGGDEPVDVEGCVTHRFSEPYFALSFGHADAASVVRWAASLGLYAGPAAGFEPGALRHQAERELLDAISWLPERVAGAARRGQPEQFARYLESLAAAYLDCRDSYPALPFFGARAPASAEVTGARLWLVAAAETALGTGMRLLGLTPRDRV